MSTSGKNIIIEKPSDMKKTKVYCYYPGCSVKSMNRAYEESLLTVMNVLKLTAPEIDDWNCCGATAYMAINELQAFALAARNLALAEQQFLSSGDEYDLNIVVPCSGCFLVLFKTKTYLEEHPEIKTKIQEGLSAIGLTYNGSVQIRHPLEIFILDIGTERLKRYVTRPLEGLKVASYYGCQMLRPFESFDSASQPTFLDDLVNQLGGEPVDWPLKTRCCGGSLMGTIHEVGIRLNYILLTEAKKRGADMVITTCPLCQINLECYQKHMARLYKEKIAMPILYFTQLMGIAFGLPDKQLGLHRLFIPPILSRL